MISKIIVGRLRPLLNRIVDLAQVAFVPNRWINENVVLAHDIIHSFKHTRKKKCFFGIKLDFQKDYNIIEWRYLIIDLKAFGFSKNFTNLIYQCLSLVQFTLLSNGGQCQSFKPMRGLCQGDPLSPYPFILSNEVLLRIINKEVADGNISRVKVSSTTPPISKLCYADDVILFYKAKASELVSFKGCLEKYCS